MTNARAIEVAAAFVQAGMQECRIVPLHKGRWGLDIYAVEGTRLCRVTKARLAQDTLHKKEPEKGNA